MVSARGERDLECCSVGTGQSNSNKGKERLPMQMQTYGVQAYPSKNIHAPQSSIPDTCRRIPTQATHDDYMQYRQVQGKARQVQEVTT